MNGERGHIIVGLGEVLWDCFASGRRPGGAPANFAYHVGLLGARGVVCSRVGRDADGDGLCAHLAKRGLTVEHIQRDAEHPTGTVTVDASQPDHPVYTIHEGVAWDHLAYTDGVAALMRSADAVCFGTLAQRSPVSGETIRRAVAEAADALIVFDVNLRQNYYSRDVIEASLAASDIVKLNEAEARVLDDLLAIRAGEAGPVARELIRRFNVALVCVTRGERGCLLVGADESVDVPGQPVKVADAVGAGDAFCAALVISRLAGWPLERCARFANAVGGLVASRAGAMPDVAADYARLRREFAEREESGKD